MSSSDNDRDTLQLTVRLGQDDLIVSVLDGFGQLVATMVDQIEAQEQNDDGNITTRYLTDVHREFDLKLPRGIYRIQGSLAGLMEESTVVLTEDIAVDAPAPAVFSAVPMAGNFTSHEYYTYPAIEVSRKATDGSGCPTCMLFVRKIEGNKVEPIDLRCSLTNHSGYLRESSTDTVRLNVTDGWFAFSVNAPTGAYVLNVEDNSGERGIPIWIAEGFQTQCFVLYEQAGLAWDTLRMLQAPADQGFDPLSESLRACELMTQSLMGGARQPQASVMNNALEGKFGNPMIGLFAAHSLLRRNRINQGLLNTVLGNLSYMLPDSPDMAALDVMFKLSKGEPIDQISIAFPPTLQAGYLGLIDSAGEHPHIITAGSLCEQVGLGLMTDTPFVTWDTGSINATGSAGSLAWVQESLMEAMLPGARFKQERSEADVAGLSRTLGVTPNVLQQAARGLIEDAGLEVEDDYPMAQIFKATKTADDTLWSTVQGLRQDINRSGSDALRALVQGSASKLERDD